MTSSVVVVDTPSFETVFGDLQAALDDELDLSLDERAARAITRQKRTRDDERTSIWQQAMELAEFDRLKLWSRFTTANGQAYTSLSAYLEEDQYNILPEAGVTKGCTWAGVYAFYVGTHLIHSPSRKWLHERYGLGIAGGYEWELLWRGNMTRLGELRRPIAEGKVELVEALEMADRDMHPDEVYRAWLKTIRQGQDPDVLDEDYVPPHTRNLVYDDHITEKFLQELQDAGIQPGQSFLLIIKRKD